MNTIGILDQISKSTYNNYSLNKNSSKSDISFNLELANQQKEEQKAAEYIKSLVTTSTNQGLYNLSNLNASVSDKLKASSLVKPEDASGSVTSTITLEKNLEAIDYDPNDLSLGVTFADKNSKTVPTLNKDITKNDNTDTSETNTRIHTDVNGTRFLIISTTVGNQTFEKSIKLSDNI